VVSWTSYGENHERVMKCFLLFHELRMSWIMRESWEVFWHFMKLEWLKSWESHEMFFMCSWTSYDWNVRKWWGFLKFNGNRLTKFLKQLLWWSFKWIGMISEDWLGSEKVHENKHDEVKSKKSKKVFGDLIWLSDDDCVCWVWKINQKLLEVI